MKKLLVIFLFLHTSGAKAQFIQDVTGLPYLQKNFDEYEGSPFLFSSWVKANLTTVNRKVYPDMLVNFDIAQNLPIFFRDEKIWTFSEEITEFTLEDHSAKMTFKLGKHLNATLPNVYLEILHEGPTLLKKYDRALVEVPTYASSNKRYRYAESTVYYVLIENEYKKINLSKENAQKVFSLKWSEIEDYAKKNNISFKSEDGWLKLLSHYKTLLG